MTIEINSARFKTPPFRHQLEGIRKLVDNESFFVADEMGMGKSYQVINAACLLAEAGEIDTVLVVCPASVRCVWLDAEIGEIKKHAWMPSSAWEFHARIKQKWTFGGIPGRADLIWVVTNYDFLRKPEHVTDLCVKLLNGNTLLVCDESAYLKNHRAQQTKAIVAIRKHCKRCILLNGTPVADSPLDLFSQMRIMEPRRFWREFHDKFACFRNEYCRTAQLRFSGSRWPATLVRGYKNLDLLAEKIAPYVIRREKKDCLDLPPKLYTEREVPLDAASWKRYRELKKDFVMSLGEGDARLEPNAAVRVLRLAQLTSGILGGSAEPIEDAENEIPHVDMCFNAMDLSDEKLKWCVQYLTEECAAKAVIVWTRWRRERERLFERLRERNDLCIVQIHGGQKREDREFAVNLFSTFGENSRRVVLLAQPHAGGHGLNLVRASEAIYLSNDFSLGMRLQSEDRCHRPGQVNSVLYTDVLATGPKGERTIDHVIFRALREKKSVADFTTAQWRQELVQD